jgi:hypothetical protein
MTSPSNILLEIVGDLWDYHRRGEWIAITTNGVVKSNGEATMGAGIALQAARRFPELPRLLGQALRESGNRPYIWHAQRIITVPTKHHWRDPSDLALICHGMAQLPSSLDSAAIPRLYCPRWGCGLGQLDWPTVRAAIAPFLDPRFVFVTPPSL